MVTKMKIEKAIKECENARDQFIKDKNWEASALMLGKINALYWVLHSGKSELNGGQ